MHMPHVRSVLDRAFTAEQIIAAALCVLLGTGLTPIPFAPAAGLLGIALLPVTLLMVRRYRGALTVMILLAAAIVSGMILTYTNIVGHQLSGSAMSARTFIALALIGGIGVILFARVHIGSAGASIFYGIGMVAGIAFAPISAVNPWRFTFSLPVIVLVLAVVSARNGLTVQVLALTALGVVGLLNDSRSNSAMLFLAAAILIWQRLSHAVSRGRRRAGHVLGILLFAIGFFQLAQFSLLEGYFGEASQLKTEAQIQTSGNLLLGGRPEAAASIALIRMYPFGFGGGLLPNGNDIYTAKSAMSAIGYNPNNGYVERFMFGSGIEVHSVLGDAWLWFGIIGALAFVAMAAVVVHGLEVRLRNSALTALMSYLTIRFFWDLLFSPITSAATFIVLTVPLAAVAMTRAAAPDRRPFAGSDGRTRSSARRLEDGLSSRS